jgi:pimeloyl-ACP methyl ester carboxylesterase
VVSGRRWVVVGSVLAAVGLVAALVIVLTRSSAPPASKGVTAQGVQGPVVLVPGYGGGTDVLQSLATDLRRHGHQAVVMRLLGDGTGDLTAQARVLQQTVDGLVAKGAPSVDVVGFSAGGVVARIWATDLGGAAKARRVVLLGSPNHGTQIAALGALFGGSLCTVACQQLVPSSALLAGLAQRGTPSGPQWVSVWTTDDEVVTPPDAARLDGAVNLTVQDVCPGRRVQHGELPRDAAVQGLVVRALAVPTFVPPAPSECAAVLAS